MAQEGSKPGYPIESVDRALSLLLALEQTDRLSVAEASRLLEVSRSTAHRLLNMLQYRGFVRQDPRTRSYTGGPALIRIGLAAVNQLDVRAVARPILERIVADVDETAHVEVLQGADTMFLDCIESTKVIRAGARTGTTLPAHLTAGGKALLATLDHAELRSLLGRKALRGLTPSSITSFDELERELEEVRKRGYAINDRESEADLRAVAALIPSPDGPLSMDAAISVSGPASRLDDKRLDEIARVLLRELSPAAAA
jgi:IclR family transcriptional regulator, acetate operon repressor